MNPKISVIVPVYNAEKTLHKCIDSILGQSYKDWELLLIDDGSTDASATICDEYAQLDNRIRAFHKQNGGVSSARNVGLKNARGEWIAFVDSDDELLPCALDVFFSGAKYRANIDLVSVGYEVYSTNGDFFSTLDEKNKNEQQVFDINQAVKRMYCDKFYQFYVFTKLFKRSVIIDAGLHFDETLYFSEDRLFIINYLCAMSGKMYYTNRPVYKYIIRKTGTMMSVVGKFNYKSLTGYEAAVKMYHCLNNNQIITKENKVIALLDVISSYNITRKAMFQHGIYDRQLVRKLNEQLRSVLSLRKYISVQLKLYIKRYVGF